MRSKAVLLGAGFILAACSKPAPKPVVVPDVYRAKFETSKGDFVVEVTKAWAPRGADRFHELLRMHYFDDGRFFRVLPGFIAQFGINKDFDVHARWRELVIADDPPKEKNVRGTLAFAQSGVNTRATEAFINLKDNPELDEDRFVPFGRVVEGMEVADMLYSGYGELGPKGRGPDAGRAENEANEYMVPRFPMLDYIKHARIME
ncbi:MAG: peptidylprolyl isomerase [Bryobacterales bacterium]|nr:peptidylprolyl isomerase [Bryobacterales bacterium]MBV9399588.1 peptidylprolyl isomerase [Bryobacterales bacterium]